jgi:hypothetical protein
MRTLVLFLVFLSYTCFTFSQNSNEKGAEISFEKLVHDFGQVHLGDPTTHEFTFTNTGNEPLIISDVRSSCGCTVPQWPRNPIMPGASESIKVKYNSNILGTINRQVTIISNAKNSPSVIRVAGNVNKAPQEILPFQQQTAAPTPTN